MRFLRLLFLVVVALAALYLAEANRAPVTISLDPFPGGDASEFSFKAPLFLVIFAAVALGVVLGAAVSWLGHVDIRRRARTAQSELAKTRSEVEGLRQQSLAGLTGDGVKK
ncbi:LapA family protein [Methylocystis bryophila]|uniref:Lipopolysaccharide assembly protein A domain-containing protein n=1 Tax=Methylocystis bryophila TaxID=655015 RepID=A0A1W6N0B2_9HYPH|nr:LapA family protein [Methylocystis bryophila]ARN83243.1 hypothetical protein B1812_00045 [Methylocystis bryophila]